MIARFSKNLLVIAAVVIVLQFGGYAAVVESGAGTFRDYSISNLSIVALLTFIWYVFAAQMHLWLHKKEPVPDPNTSKGQ